MQRSIAKLSGRYSPDPVRRIVISDYRMLNRNTSETMPGWQSWRLKSLICGAKDWASMKCRRSCNAILPIAKKSPPGSGGRSKNWSWHNYGNHHILMWIIRWSASKPPWFYIPQVVCLLTTWFFRIWPGYFYYNVGKHLKKREEIIITPSGTSMT